MRAVKIILGTIGVLIGVSGFILTVADMNGWTDRAIYEPAMKVALWSVGGLIGASAVLHGWETHQEHKITPAEPKRGGFQTLPRRD